MPPKQKKITLWSKCASCGVDTPCKSIKVHSENCQDTNYSWKIPYISKNIFYSILEFKDSSICDVDLSQDFVLLHNSVIQMCNFVIGDPVKIQFCSGDILEPIVKRIWPSVNLNNLTSAIVNNEDLPVSWQNASQSKIRVSKFIEPVNQADVVHISTDSKNFDIDGFISNLKCSQTNKMFSCFSNKINCKYLGVANILVKIESVNNVQWEKLPKETWYVSGENTKWVLEKSKVPSDNNIFNHKEIAGVDSILDRISFYIKMSLFNEKSPTKVRVLKSILLFGPSGTGKSMISKNVASITDVNVVSVNASDIYSKFVGETKNSLNKLYQSAVMNAPSVILIDDIDILCPIIKNNQGNTVTPSLVAMLDRIHNDDSKIFFIGCTNKIDNVDTRLRSWGRIDQEIEMPVPDHVMRCDILSNLLSNVPHNMTAEEIKTISSAAHGYVGADLANLCTQASMHMFRDPCQRNILCSTDFEWALNHVSPSAMREALVNVPNVKWSDVGGQEDLKLKLKQLVEWPLKYADSFTRLGIKPPSGILMYGPPGCSKTMITKAVASESRLNFLSIKGPELFSKWVGESERAVRDLFRKARQVAPSIIFFDEIDALGTERSKTSSSSNVQERILAQLLTEMDGITPLGNVTIIAATNRPDKIDAALLRPGRLDRIVYVPLPDESTRESIFKLRLSKMACSKSVCIADLVKNSEGYSGAEIMAVCNEAALKALEQDIAISEVMEVHFRKAFDVVQPRTPESLLSLYENFGKNV